MSYTFTGFLFISLNFVSTCPLQCVSSCLVYVVKYCHIFPWWTLLFWEIMCARQCCCSEPCYHGPWFPCPCLSYFPSSRSRSVLLFLAWHLLACLLEFACVDHVCLCCNAGYWFFSSTPKKKTRFHYLQVSKMITAPNSISLVYPETSSSVWLLLFCDTAAVFQIVIMTLCRLVWIVPIIIPEDVTMFAKQAWTSSRTDSVQTALDLFVKFKDLVLIKCTIFKIVFCWIIQ